MKKYRSHGIHRRGPHLGYALVLRDAPWYKKLIKIRGIFWATNTHTYWFTVGDK